MGTQTFSVVHIVSALPFGGVETNLLRVLPRLDRERFAVRVVCIRDSGDLAPAMEAAGVPVDFVKMQTRYDPPSLWRLRGYLCQHQVRIAHCHMRRANTSGRIAAMLARVPVRIATEHDMVVDKSWRHHCVDRLLARWTDVILGVTQGVVNINQTCSGIPADKFRVMYLGLELESLAQQPERFEARVALGLPKERRIAGFVGRLHEIKNVDQIVRAMRKPALEGVDLAIIGDGAERQRLEALVQEAGLTERVHFTGYRTDLPTVYAALDCLVLASRSEGIATVQMEAVAAGVPLVSTRVGLAAEVFTPGAEYIQVPSATPDALAAGMAQALTPEIAAGLRTAGRKTIQRFSIEAQVKYLDDLYVELGRKHGLLDPA